VFVVPTFMAVLQFQLVRDCVRSTHVLIVVNIKKIHLYKNLKIVGALLDCVIKITLMSITYELLEHDIRSYSNESW
jgi:hypothetical protein